MVIFFFVLFSILQVLISPDASMHFSLHFSYLIYFLCNKLTTYCDASKDLCDSAEITFPLPGPEKSSFNNSVADHQVGVTFLLRSHLNVDAF